MNLKELVLTSLQVVARGVLNGSVLKQLDAAALEMQRFYSAVCRVTEAIAKAIGKNTENKDMGSNSTCIQKELLMLGWMRSQPALTYGPCLRLSEGPSAVQALTKGLIDVTAIVLCTLIQVVVGASARTVCEVLKPSKILSMTSRRKGGRRMQRPWAFRC